MPDLTIHVQFFARYAEVVERDHLTLTVPAGATVADAVRALRGTIPGADRLPETPMVALNRAHVPHRQPLRDGDELALLPPLAGG